MAQGVGSRDDPDGGIRGPRYEWASCEPGEAFLGILLATQHSDPARAPETACVPAAFGKPGSEFSTLGGAACPQGNSMSSGEGSPWSAVV